MSALASAPSRPPKKTLKTLKTGVHSAYSEQLCLVVANRPKSRFLAAKKMWFLMKYKLEVLYIFP